MDALQLLLNRQSMKKLKAPAPAGKELENILQAGLRAPDHGRLHPYYFYIFENESCQKFSDLLKQAVVDDNLGESLLIKAQKMAVTAPMIIVVTAHCQPLPKVPEWEQILTAGCALHAMQMAAFAQGFGGVWLTGAWIDSAVIKAAFECKEQDKVVGFLFLGTPASDYPTLQVLESDNFTRYIK